MVGLFVFGETGRNVSRSLIENMSFKYVIWCCCVVIAFTSSLVVFEIKSGKLVGLVFSHRTWYEHFILVFTELP